MIKIYFWEDIISVKKGKQYEEQACIYLGKNGWKILHRNYHSRYGEIDIITEKDGALAFVEVKGREKRTSWIDDAVPISKQQKIRKTAEIFLLEEEVEYEELQFGVVWIEGDDITLIENAF